jgi:hypothetical protein
MSVSAAVEKNPYRGMSIEEMPDVITAQHIGGHLGMSAKAAYNLLHLSPDVGGIRSFNVGKLVRAHKSDYIKWFNQTSKTA